MTLSVTQRKRIVGRGYDGYGRRPTNNWGHGNLPAPFAIGDLVEMTANANTSRMRGMTEPGLYVVLSAWSIDEGDAWYFRVTNDKLNASDRHHVAHAERSTWDKPVDWMAGFRLIETADPDGLAKREALIAAGWSMPDCGSHERPCPRDCHT
jgi:hypothetical protein